MDLHHGASPFIVTIADDRGENIWWEWDVDPRTRNVCVPQADLEEIQNCLDKCRKVILQNPKFDNKALKNIGITLPWEKVEDTLMMGHLLDSKMPHNLTDMCIQYLGMNIQHREDKLEKICKTARNLVRSKFKDWKIAKSGYPDMPSADSGGDKKKSAKRGNEKDTKWKFDAWLPRAVAEYIGYHDDHPWRMVAADYANDDSASTRLLYIKQMQICKQRGLVNHYRDRLKLLPVVAKMEERGVTVSGKRLEEMIQKYGSDSAGFKQVCEEIACKRRFTFNDQPLTLPRGARSDALESFVFDSLKMPVVKKTEAGGRAMDKGVIGYWLTQHESNPEGDEFKFLSSLASKRSRDTAVSYMKGYKRFWLKLKKYNDWYRLHPNFNPTGTDTLRFGCSNPNAQNVSKKKGFNLRYNFGPAPGREWWALDYENLELRLPAYEAGETAMIELFESPDKAPFFGSYHLLVFSILHTNLWAEHGAKVKDLFKDTWYQWTKNGNFAVQYGAQESSGTADAAYHVKGGQAMIQNRFTNIKVLSAKIMEEANKTGFVSTMPRKSVNPSKGYPLTCTRTQYNKVLPTVPLSYHIQGTAMECTTGAMVRCDPVLDGWTRDTGSAHFMTMQVHDEIVFDFPKGRKKNIDKVMLLRDLMEQSGADIGVPLKVSVSYHPCNWSEAQSI